MLTTMIRNTNRNLIKILFISIAFVQVAFIIYFYFFGGGSIPFEALLVNQNDIDTKIDFTTNHNNKMQSYDKKKEVKPTKLNKNPIAIENELPGTKDWMIENPATNHEVEGYMSRTSIEAGESIALYHSIYTVTGTDKGTTTSSHHLTTVRIEIFRSGWYQGLGGKRVHVSSDDEGQIEIQGIVQTMPQPDPENGLIVCNWTNPYIIQTDTSWTTGVYLVKLTNMDKGLSSYTIFVIRDNYNYSNLDAKRTKDFQADVLFQLPTNTYQAYNIWGGKNLYRCNLHKNCNRAYKVSFDRPYAGPENVKFNATSFIGIGAAEYFVNVQPSDYPIATGASWNYNMVRWLEKNGVHVSYVTNADVHSSLHVMPKPKLLLSQGHGECLRFECNILHIVEYEAY